MDVKNTVLTLRLSKKDKDYIVKKAEEAGVSTSKYLLKLGLNSSDHWSSNEMAANTVRKIRGRV